LTPAFALAGQAGDAPPGKVVIPFDFESRFDDGAYGRILGDMLWMKLKRQGGFILPESMQDVRDWCQRARFLPGPDTPLPRMKEAVVTEQAGDIAIWGKVERVAGHDEDVYDFWIVVADFSVDPTRTIHRKEARTRTVSEIPHIHVKEALDRLHGRHETASAAPAPDPAREVRWRNGPNLVRGDFEKGREAPTGWTPLPHDVSWTAEGGKDRAARNHVVRFTMDAEVAGTTGALYYSDFFPVEEGATYRFQCRWKSTGSAAKVFIKCYDELPTRDRGRPGGEPLEIERREVYRSQQNLTGPAGGWNVQTEDFTPTHTQFTPRWGRVMLYAYWPAGTVDWDDVVVKRVAPAPPRTGPKDRRPSTETKVRTRELDEDPAAPETP
jgi:hypothetical protein